MNTVRTISVSAIAAMAVVIGGCASTAPELAWGKAGVSKVEYGTDVGMCTGLAAMQKVGNGANTAGGIDGRGIGNAASPPTPSTAPPANAGTSQQTQQVDAPLPANGSYAGMATADFAQRAASQQRSVEMAGQRARAEAFKGCLVERGYREFPLTAEQRTQLATLKKGSPEYHEYLYQLSSDPEILGRQPLAAK